MGSSADGQLSAALCLPQTSAARCCACHTMGRRSGSQIDPSFITHMCALCTLRPRAPQHTQPSLIYTICVIFMNGTGPKGTNRQRLCAHQLLHYTNYGFITYTQVRIHVPKQPHVREHKLHSHWNSNAQKSRFGGYGAEFGKGRALPRLLQGKNRAAAARYIIEEGLGQHAMIKHHDEIPQGE